MLQDFSKKYFLLFSNCAIVKGFKRSLIVDTHRNESRLIPNDLTEILNKSKIIPIEKLYSEYGETNMEVIQEYFKILRDLELGFFCSENELSLFADMSHRYETPAKINNAIFEEIYSVEKYKELQPQIEDLGCEYLEILLYNEISNENLLEILDGFFTSSVKYIGLIMKYDSTKDKDFIKYITSTKLRVCKVLIHSAEETMTMNSSDFNLAAVQYLTTKISSFNFCGAFGKHYFTINIPHFTESQNHNTCLNKKISIDKEGNIKNCPAMPESFGNIKDSSLAEALNHPNFKKYWNINKDQIDVCKDCEFRHICTDCRAFTEDPENQYSKPLKCGYNPYTNEWEEWSTNPLKQKAIEYYGMQELIKKDV